MIADTTSNIVAIITAVFAGIASLFAIWVKRDTGSTKQALSMNGDPRTPAQAITDVANTVGATAEKSPIPSPDEPKPA